MLRELVGPVGIELEGKGWGGTYVECRVDQDSGIVPAGGLNPNCLMKCTDLLQILAHNCDVVFREEGSVKTIRRPHHVFDASNGKLCKLFLLLDVIENDRSRRQEKQASWTTKCDIRGSSRSFDRFGG